MADVLIVCVREDEPQAKALADMFEAAGFSIGGAPSSDGALRSSGAGVIVWSQASIRSRPFLDAAQRVINADKAVVASLIEPPPPSSVGESPAFDLSHWDGDPDDPALDPLFFAVDRMVNSARAAVGAPAVVHDEEPRLEPRRTAPMPRLEPTRPEPPRRAEPPRAAPAPQPDRIETEAEYWRAIRDSKNPADFMDYIARFGANGAFTEVAEIRLKQLTSGGASSSAPARQPTPPPPPRQSTPPRPTLPPRMEASRRLDPTPARRADPPPPTRRSEPTPQRRPEQALPPRRPTYDRSYERTEIREPKGEGGGIRAFVLIALLCGAALAGGLYFGGGIGAPEQQNEQVASAPSDEPATYDGTEATGDDPSTVPLPDAAPERPTSLAEARPSRAEQQRAERQEQERERRAEAQRTREQEPPTPAPTNNWAATQQTSGPVSLRPGEQTSIATPSNVATPPAPTTSPPSVLASNTSSAAATPARPGAVRWSQRPSARRIAELYPQRAARDGVGGRVELDCMVRSDLGVSCSVASETPAGEGFGRAAIAAASAYRADPSLSNGAAATGARTRIAVNFQAPSN